MKKRVYVGNLAYDVTSEALAACFSKYGDVAETRIITDRETSRPRGFAFVTMQTEAEAVHVVGQLNGALFEGRPLRVSSCEVSVSQGIDRHVWGGHRGW